MTSRASRRGRLSGSRGWDWRQNSFTFTSKIWWEKFKWFQGFSGPFVPGCTWNCIDNEDTFAHIACMVKSSNSTRKNLSSLAVAERPPVFEPKGSINLRIESRTRQLIDDAAAVLGKTRTEFMIDSARSLAIDVLLDQRLFLLNPERFDVFLDALDNPSPSGPKLRTLLRRVPAWQR